MHQLTKANLWLCIEPASAWGSGNSVENSGGWATHSQAVSVDREASIFSTGGIWA